MPKRNRNKNNTKNRSNSDHRQAHQERMRTAVEGMQKITGAQLRALLNQAIEDTSNCTSKSQLEKIAKYLGFTKIGQKGHMKWERYQEVQSDDKTMIQCIGPSSSSSPKGKNWQAPAKDFMRAEYVENVIAFYIPA